MWMTPSSYSRRTHKELFNKAKDRDWFEFFKKVQESLRFEVEETHQLKAGEPIDYCSIRIQLQENGDMTLDNSQCVDKILADANMEDCNGVVYME